MILQTLVSSLDRVMLWTKVEQLQFALNYRVKLDGLCSASFSRFILLTCHRAAMIFPSAIWSSLVALLFLCLDFLLLKAFTSFSLSPSPIVICNHHICKRTQLTIILFGNIYTTHCGAEWLAVALPFYGAWHNSMASETKWLIAFAIHFALA